MNLYLIESSSRIRTDEEIKKIIKTNPSIVYSGEDTTIEEILSEASYVSMFDEMKYVVIKNANFFGSVKLNEEDENYLIKYLEKPYPMCTIIFTTAYPTDGRKKNTKYIKDNYRHLLIPELKGLDLYQKVASLFAEKKYFVEKEIIQYVIQSCLNNYDLIYNEINKIDLFYNQPTKVNMNDVKKIVSRTLIDNNFKFLDAVLSGDIKKTFLILEDLITCKVEALSLLNLLAREYRNMLEIKILEEEKRTKAEISKELKLMDWQFDKTKRFANNFHKEDLKDYLIELEKIDYKIKSGQIDAFIGLKIFLITYFEFI